ncbi:MAG: universal stress protein [Wenzhouxiangella sp.]|nr:universal stress protein [Wenzhouxiangella sp.]
MGRRGLSKIKSLLMGSVSSKVAAHAPGLVTVV